MGLLFDNSEQLMDWVVEHNPDGVLLSFSTGKDSLASWLRLREYGLKVYPLYFQSVPGLRFVERSLDYFEQYFGTHIMRLPHPGFYRMLNAQLFQSPEHCQIIEDARLPEFTFEEGFDICRQANDLPDEMFAAVGVRAFDSPLRWASVKRHGAVNLLKRQFYPIYDWKKDRLVDTLRASGVKLSLDYRMFGRSFDGLDWRYMKPMKEMAPDDYARVLEWFPLAELELKRMEFREAYYREHP